MIRFPRLSRSFAISAQPSLDIQLPGLRSSSTVDASSLSSPKIQTLQNGAKFVSTGNPSLASPVASLGAFISVGSAVVPSTHAGTSHLMEHLAFGSTLKRTNLRVLYDAQTLGVSLSAASSRDTFCVAADFLPTAENLSYSSDLLGEILNQPKFAPWDIDEKLPLLALDSEAMEGNPEMKMEGLIHEAAFGTGKGLGKSTMAPEGVKISSEQMKSLYKTFMKPENMVFVSSGLSDEQVSEVIGTLDTEFSASPSYAEATEFAPDAVPGYKGSSKLEVGYTGLSGVALGVNGINWKSSSLEDIVNSTVLYFLCGGGGSFSAGGPGKGLYSRLYQRVLTSHLWVEHSNCFNHMYDRTGVFGVQGLAPDENLGDMATVLAEQLVGLMDKGGYTSEEVERAKKQTESALVMRLEERKGLWEDVGRQVLVYGNYTPAETYIESVRSVTADSLAAVAQKMIKGGNLTLAGMGNVGKLPDYDQLNQITK
eukprot:augustus_masked-scaffold_33-processed-gene-3.63-mRNA-1 protein AED:1.00 eAED:1.00 QI:0/-1/0/0/-1/1/1/0/481